MARSSKIKKTPRRNFPCIIDRDIDISYHLSYYHDNEVKYFDWDEKKNKRLRAERKIGFEEVRQIIEEGELLDTVAHPNKARYPNQKMFVVEINDYVYLVPFVEDEEKYFLKTIFPSRKATKKYLTKRGDK